MVDLERAKTRVREIVRRNQQIENDDSEPLFPAYKKSRVVPKSSGVLKEDDVSRRIEGDSAGTDAGSKKLDIFAAGPDTEDRTEGQKNDVKSSETKPSPARKSLPFIGKLPFLKAPRGTKQVAAEQNAADDKSKIEIKLPVSVSYAVSTPTQSEPALYAGIVSTYAQQQAVPKWSMSVPTSNMENSTVGEPDSLDAFLSIGDPESGQCQAVPVLNVGPLTHSEFILENPPSKTQSSQETEVLIASSKAGESASSCGADNVTVPYLSANVQAANTGEVKDVQSSGSVSTSNPRAEGQSYVALLSNSSEPVRQMKGADADAAGITAMTDTASSTDPSHTIVDHENTSAMSLDDDNTEDYKTDDTKTEQLTVVPRDEDTAQLLPQISAVWMQPADSGYFALSHVCLFISAISSSSCAICS